MKSSTAISFVMFAASITALPQQDLEKRADPDLAPVSFDQLTTSGVTCGGTQYSAHDIYLAAQYGVLLAEDGQGRGKKSNQYPNGRFPHPFTANNNGVSLNFLPGCPDGDDARAEYPLVLNGPYNGGISNNVNWGPDRVVYMHEAGEVDDEGHFHGIYCGVMTHTGASASGSFVLC